MCISFDVFTKDFLSKISEYDLMELPEESRQEIVDGYMKRAINAFNKICTYDLNSTRDDDTRTFTVDIEVADLDEIADIVSEGMVVQWLKPFLNKQELLENVLNTKDFSTFSPGGMLEKVRASYQEAQREFKQAMLHYSYRHGRLDELSL